jgi:hypothetical protein
MCVGVTVWFGWGGVVSLCRLKHFSASACFLQDVLSYDINMTIETCAGKNVITPNKQKVKDKVTLSSGGHRGRGSTCPRIH